MNHSLWFKDAVFYEVYLRAFADGNGDGHGDFQGLTAHLDYFRDLGVDCLWLQPIYPSPLKDDGYDISDYCNIHPSYGSLEDFKAFLEAAHARGLRVILDLVLNHTSDQHPWFQAARRRSPERGEGDAGRNSPYHDYYVWSDTDQKYKDARIIFLDTERSNWTWDPVAGQFFWHRFYSSQPDLNYDNPAVRTEMLNVLKFWLDLGVDGFRADAVPYLFEREGTSCENLPETHAFLKQMRRFIDDRYPNRVLLAEANQWPEDLFDYFGAGDEFHMGFHFPLMPRLFMALRRAEAAPIHEILKRTPLLPDVCQWGLFLRNHDELTLEMVTPEEREWMWREYAPDPRMRLNLGIRRRLAPLLDNDQRRIELAHAVLFSLPGSPVLYYGDEIGMGDNIHLPDRNGVRTPMQWDAGPQAGFSSVPAERLYAPLIAEGSFSYQTVNVAAQRALPHSLWHALQRLLAVRKAHLAFGRGTYALLDPGSPAVLAVLRSHSSETILALHNLSAEPQLAQLDLHPWAGTEVVSLFPDHTPAPVRKTLYRVSLRPYEYCWLKLK